MNDTNSPDVEKRFETLAEVASTLNKASDEFSAAITILDDSLQNLNLGLTVWVTYFNRDKVGPEYDCDQLGYAKIGGKWGLGIRRIAGDGRDDFEELRGEWPFSDAPRAMRMSAVKSIPELIEELTAAAIQTLRDLNDKTQSVQEIAAGLIGVAKQRSTEAPAQPPYAPKAMDPLPGPHPEPPPPYKRAANPPPAPPPYIKPQGGK
jgi:hypothetical protein